jgi:hypothetical protein
LADTFVFERLQELRNVAATRVWDDLLRASNGDDDSAEAPLALELDVEDTEDNVPEQPKKRQRRTVEKSLRMQMPSVLEVTYERAGREPWVVSVLGAAANRAPAIEVTAANMQTLFELVDADRLAGRGRRAVAKSTDEDRKSPRGPLERRAYWNSRRRRWIIKEKTEQTTGSPKRRQRYRTLVRRGSDESTRATTSIAGSPAATTSSPTGAASRTPMARRTPKAPGARRRAPGRRVDVEEEAVPAGDCLDL